MKKTVLLAIVAAIVLAAQVFSPVAAATEASMQAYEDCGDTYTVQRGEYLAQIARNCGTSVASILALNPQIVNPSLIYVGTVLRLTSDAPATYIPVSSSGAYATTAYSASASVRLSTIYAQAGSQVKVYVSGFPAYAAIDYRIGEAGETYSAAYDGTVGADGTTSKTLTIPSDASTGEVWVVEVLTTGLKSGVDVVSSRIYITNSSAYTGTSTSTNTTYSGYARVGLSSVEAAVGDTITVSMNGFPANADVDIRLGLRGETYSVVYDATVGSDGSATATITIPSSASSGEYWVVQVLTTELKYVVSVTSHPITITD
jgi:LysM repeat protein